MIKLKKLLAESKNKYVEIEFVCYNSDFQTPDYLKKQIKLFNDLKKIKGVLAYRQDFSENKNTQISLSAIILDTENKKILKKEILDLAKKYNIKIDIINMIDDNTVDSIITKKYSNNIEL